MRRWLPFPLLTAALLALWLLLTGSMAPGTVILGGVLALGAGKALTALDPPKSRFRRPRAALRLALVVLAEIVRSNWAVARIILLPGRRQRRSGFVRIPLDMRAPYGLAALACIITATPGTPLGGVRFRRQHHAAPRPRPDRRGGVGADHQGSL